MEIVDYEVVEARIPESLDSGNVKMDGNIYNFELLTKRETVDATGAGDAFISSIIKDCLKNNFNYDVNKFPKWYENLFL